MGALSPKGDFRPCTAGSASGSDMEVNDARELGFVKTEVPGRLLVESDSLVGWWMN